MTDSSNTRQNQLHSLIEKYVNGGGQTRADKLLSIFSSKLSYGKHAGQVVDTFHHYWSEASDVPNDPTVIEVLPYEGSHKLVITLAAALEPLSKDLHGAFVHGSLADEPQIAYSDFDGLIILKNSVFDSAARLAATARSLGQLRRYMYRIDPLQHHGWFVITEADLCCYCNAWFPVELFAYSRSLLRGGTCRLTVTVRDSTPEYREAFRSLSGAILKRLDSAKLPTDAYELKRLMSQIMLLPALYLQARNGTVTHKKFSFELARTEFEPATWAVMDEISAVRSDWAYEASAVSRYALSNWVTRRSIATRWLAPAIPANLAMRLSPEVYSRVRELIRAMTHGVGGKS